MKLGNIAKKFFASVALSFLYAKNIFASPVEKYGIPEPIQTAYGPPQVELSNIIVSVASILMFIAIPVILLIGFIIYIKKSKRKK